MLSEKQKIQIDYLYAHGNNLKEIAQELNLSYRQVHHYKSQLTGERCLQCGKAIKQTPHKRKKKFCSDKCRITWWNHNADMCTRTPHHTHECEYCHKTFNCYRAVEQKYCSRECYNKARRKG